MINIAKIEEYYLFHIVSRNLPDILSFVEGQDLIATINSQFFQEIFNFFQIFHLHNSVTTFLVPIMLLIFILMLQFVTLFFNFSFGKKFFNILPEKFVLPYHVCKQVMLSFQTVQTIFSIFLIPLLQKNNGPSLT